MAVGRDGDGLKISSTLCKSPQESSSDLIADESVFVCCLTFGLPMEEYDLINIE